MKFAFCGTWHVHAGEYCQAVMQHGEVVGVYEPNAQWRKSFCEKFGIPEFETMDELLASDADGVIVCSATSSHTEDIIKIAKAKKDIFSEKVLALTVEDCEKIKKAVAENNVKFVISLPHKYKAAMQTVKMIADSGELGKLNYFRFRNCHNGAIRNWLPAHFYSKEECGGGAMIDLGAHGMYLANWFLGMPDTYGSGFGYCTDREVEDNAVTVMGYKNGAVAVNETSFVSNCSPITLELGGERGFVVYRKDNGDDSKVIKATIDTDYKPVEVEMCPDLPIPIIQFACGNILEGCDIEEAIKLTKMMVSAYSERKTV